MAFIVRIPALFPIDRLTWTADEGDTSKKARGLGNCVIALVYAMSHRLIEAFENIYLESISYRSMLVRVAYIMNSQSLAGCNFSLKFSTV